MFVSDTALIFEGGAMRNAYTAAVVDALVRSDIVFPKAYGISAGAALAVFYASRNPERARAMFTDAVRLKRAGGPVSLFEGHGFFDLQFLLEGLSETNTAEHNRWTFDFRQLKEGPTDVHVEAFAMETGATAAWTRDDMPTLTACMTRVQASCSYPLFTPATEVDGQRYIDGGMGTSHGICLDAARADGFSRFFIVCTQPRGYRKGPLGLAKREAYRVAYRRYPKVVEALEARPAAYDRLLDEIDGLERDGVAYVFHPDTMPITYKTVDYDALCRAYDLGTAQCARELPSWKQWLASA